MNIDEKIVDKATRMAEDLLDEYGDSGLALTTSIAVLAMIARKVYPEQKYYEQFIRTVVVSLIAAPKGSPL